MSTLQNKNILLISPENWDGLFVSKHHYAIKLSERGNSVYFLQPPSNKWSVKEINPSLKVISFREHLKGLRFLPEFIQAYLISRDIKKIEELIGSKIDIIWNFDSSRYYNLAEVTDTLKICHIVDLNQDFKREALAKTSTYCFGNSDPICDSLKSHNPNTFKISHGLNIQNTPGSEVEIPGNNRIKVIYSGSLDIIYLDHSIVNKLVSTFQNVDFIFIGSFSQSNKLLENPATNKFLIGKKESHLLQSYYQKADVLLVTYNANEYLEQLANPHKMLEYLYSGKVIVATKTLEYCNNPLIETALSLPDFITKFKKIIENLDSWNSEEKMRKRKSFAMRNTYENQIARISEILEQNKK